MDNSQVTPVRIGDMHSASISSIRVSQMADVAQGAGLTLSGILDRAIELWLSVEGPVYLDYAKRQLDQRV